MKLSFDSQEYLRRGKIFSLNPNVFFLGLVSLLTDGCGRLTARQLPFILALPLPFWLCWA